MKENKELFNKVYNLIISISARYLFLNCVYADGKHTTYEICVGNKFIFNNISNKIENKIKIELEDCADGFTFWHKVTIEIKIGKERYIKEIDTRNDEKLTKLYNGLKYILDHHIELELLPYEFVKAFFFDFLNIVEKYEKEIEKCEQEISNLEKENYRLERELNSYYARDVYYDE